MIVIETNDIDEVKTYYRCRLELPRLQYTVCTDGTLVDLYSVQQGKSFWDGHKDSDLKVREAAEKKWPG